MASLFRCRRASYKFQRKNSSIRGGVQQGEKLRNQKASREGVPGVCPDLGREFLEGTGRWGASSGALKDLGQIRYMGGVKSFVERTQSNGQFGLAKRGMQREKREVRTKTGEVTACSVLFRRGVDEELPIVFRRARNGGTRDRGGGTGTSS